MGELLGHIATTIGRGLAVSALILTSHATSLGAAERPERWAAPVAIAGTPNLHKVSDALYRCAQPSAEGMRNLEALGVKTVLSLRSFHSDEREASGTTLELVRVRFDTWDVDEDELVDALRVLRDPEKQPVLVHCKHGADRTGMIIALHRIVFEGWTKAEAIDEMKNGGYGWHSVWTHIPRYLESVDVEALKARIEK
jgi:protein tyrosine/serine phosphatase